MIYLDTKHCGYDLNAIGFPSVETCMAVVLETADWLVGWHASSAPLESTKLQAETFKLYIQKMGDSKAKRLYGVTHKHRYKELERVQQEHKEELKAIAKKIGFHGKITGVILDVPRADYVEYRRVGNGNPCLIYYRNSAEVDYTPGQVKTAWTRHQVIKPGTKSASPLYGGKEGTAPIVTGVTAKVGNLDLQPVNPDSWINF